jgi:hypothetical protein
MNHEASEAMIVAVLAGLALFAMHGGMDSLPSIFSLRKLLIVFILMAVALGVLAYAVRN